MKMNKEQFLKTEFGGELESTITAWDDALSRNREDKEVLRTLAWCQAQWEVYRMAIKHFYGVEYHFTRSYVGKIINDYDGKQMFVAAIGAYHKGLLGNVLDKSYDNVVAIDIDAQRTYLESRGMDTSEMDDIAVAKANTGTKVFIASNVKFVNAMEDLKMNVNM